MQIVLKSSLMNAFKARGVAPLVPGARIRELEPYVFEVPAQIIIYGDDEPVILDGVAEGDGSGNTTIIVDNGDVPPAGSPVQIIIFIDPELAPIVIEGITTGGGEDGVIGILQEVPDDLLN